MDIILTFSETAINDDNIDILMFVEIFENLLCYFNVIPWEKFSPYFINGFLFKIFFAAFDTPFFYLFSHILKKKFG